MESTILEPQIIGKDSLDDHLFNSFEFHTYSLQAMVLLIREILGEKETEARRLYLTGSIRSMYSEL